MQKKSGQKVGFTLIELIIVVAVLAALAAVAVPAFAGLVDTSKASVCLSNRSSIVRYYYYERESAGEDRELVKLSDVLSGEYEIYAEDSPEHDCPSGGVYSADDENELIICSIHGSEIDEDDSEGTGEDPGENPPAQLPTPCSSARKVATRLPPGAI